MAVIAPTIVDIGLTGSGYVFQVIWAAVTENDSCRAVQYPEYADKSIQVSGTFGGASVALHGSNDGTNFAALNDASGTVIAITTAKIKAVLENTFQIKPVITGGAAQSLNVSMLIHISNPLRT